MKFRNIFLAAILTITCACQCGKDGEPTVEKPEVETPVKAEKTRAVWVPDPSHSTMLHSYANLLQKIHVLDQAGVNMLYVCVQARDKVAFDSQVYLANSSYRDIKQVNMFTPYAASYNIPTKSPTSDPLQDLITEAHKRDMQVVFWFEYGFMASHGKPSPAFSLLAKHPEWKSQGNDGDQANYNKTDYYLNSYHEGLQQFMLDLLKESMTLYPEVDGVQGDDRMPAAPRNSGYDVYTKALYKKEFGVDPPYDYNNAQWVSWRLKNLNTFAQKLHKMVKGVGEDKMLCFSPNPYPWCLDKLMQDWPTWLKNKGVDKLSVQCYRYTTDAYQATLKEVLKHVSASGASRKVVNPGVILWGGSQKMTPEVLRQILQINRQEGTDGEAFFWEKGFEDTGLNETITDFYKEK